MKIGIISFTETGIALSKRIKEKCREQECMLYTKCSMDENCIEESVDKWAEKQMQEKSALLFIGACGIAVRAIAPYIKDKLCDSPVLVMDEKGNYVIPILSGHMGGANALALYLAEKTGATAVLTTATDIQHSFAIDLFAKKNNLAVVNREGIAKISAKVLAGQQITMVIEPGHVRNREHLPKEIRLLSYPPSEAADVVVTTQEETFDAKLLLRPREYVIGIGCRKGKEAEQLEAFIRHSMENINICEKQLLEICSIVHKKEEQGLIAWSRKKGIPFVTYCPEELQEIHGDFHTSSFVEKQVGVDNVCERAALKGCGEHGKLVYEKHARDGMTIAIARREWSVAFDEA